MFTHAVRLILWLRRKSFFRVAQRTLVILMPLATFGAYFELVRDCFFSPNSLLYNVLNFDYVMPDSFWDLGFAVTSSMVHVTLGLFGLYAAYFAAEYTARLYHKDATLAGVMSMVVVLFCAYISTSEHDNIVLTTFYSRLLTIDGLLLALLIGYLIGQIFHWLGKDYHHVSYESISQIRKRAWNALFPCLITILVGLLLGLTIYYFDWRLLDSNAIKRFVARMQNSTNLWVIIPLTMLTAFLWWAGIGYPLAGLTNAANSGAAMANLNFALRHGGASRVPYPYLGSSLINAYGLMGDACIALSLTVCLLLFTRKNKGAAIAKLNLLPVAFGVQDGLAIGLPLILNPIYLLPIVVIPAMNELLAAGAISLHWLLPSVYPVLKGLPGILISFFGTNGNWLSFSLTLLLFLLDVMLLLPVIFLAQRVREELVRYDAQDDH